MDVSGSHSRAVPKTGSLDSAPSESLSHLGPSLAPKLAMNKETVNEYAYPYRSAQWRAALDQ